MAKLHELLAVGGNLDTQASTTRQDLINTFGTKKHHFAEKRVTFTSLDEGSKPVTEEQSDIQATVASEVKWISEIMAKHIDVGHQVDVANTLAKADVVLEDGTTILLKSVPATSLLQLEKRIQEVLTLAKAIPTLDPTKGFKPDTDKGVGVYAAREVTKNRTKKANKVVVKYPATDKHPAQTEMVIEDVVIGTIREQEWSSATTPAIKGDVISRIEVVLRAVKKARARANEQELDVASNKIGQKVLEYVFEPLTKAAQ
jgi:hypothetical protein